MRVLYGAVLYSEEPHAVLEELRLGTALTVDGVVGALTADGVKGLAEVPSLATAPAISASIYDAVGARMFQLPMTNEMIKAALEKGAE